METAEIIREVKGLHTDVKAALEKAGSKSDELSARMSEVEQKLARRGSSGDERPPSIGQQVVESEGFKSVAAAGGGKARINLKTTITSGSTSGGPLVAPDFRPMPDMMPQRKLSVRDLVSQGQTTSNAITYPRQTTRTTNAAVQATEGAAKAESAYAFEFVSAPVVTIAHWVPAAKQILDDAPMLAATIDNELRYGLADVEENQILNGSGSGGDIHGIYTQATAFSTPFTVAGPTMLDVLLLAIAQLSAANYEPDGLVMNGTDYARILALKDGDGRYLGGGPFTDAQVQRLWTLPVATTSSMSTDKFLVGAFKRGAQVFTRQESTVEISTEHSDYFVKNLVAIRAEERLALAVYRTGAFVKGDFSDAITAATAA